MMEMKTKYLVAAELGVASFCASLLYRPLIVESLCPSAERPAYIYATLGITILLHLSLWAYLLVDSKTVRLISLSLFLATTTMAIQYRMAFEKGSHWVKTGSLGWVNDTPVLGQFGLPFKMVYQTPTLYHRMDEFYGRCERIWIFRNVVLNYVVIISVCLSGVGIATYGKSLLKRRSLIGSPGLTREGQPRLPHHRSCGSATGGSEQSSPTA